MKLHSHFQNKSFFRIILSLAVVLTVFQTAAAQMSSPRFRLAQSLLNNHEYKEALNIFQELYQDQPQNIFVIKGMQDCYRSMQSYDELIMLLTKVAGQFPSDINWRINLAEAYYLNDNHVRANEIWYNIIDYQPKNILVYRKVAGSMINQRLLDQAIEVYLAAQQNISGQENLHIDIANLYKLQLAYGLSTRHLLEFYAHNPNQKTFVQNQILTLTDESEKIPEILEAIEEFSLQYPHKKEVSEIKAGIYIKLGAYERALESYQQLEDEKSGGAYLVRFAISARNNGAYKEALKAYQLVLELNPDIPTSAQIYYDMANCYKNLSEPANTGNLSRAISIYDSLTNTNVSAQIKLASFENLGDIYFQNYFDLDRAQYYYNEYLKTGSQNRERDRVVLKLGDVYRAKNDLGMAQRTYRQVAQNELQDLSIYKLTELVYFRGQFTQAEKNFNKLLQSIGTNHVLTNDILTYLADIREFKSDSVALAAFARAQLLEMREKKSESVEEFSRLVYDKTPLGFRALTHGVENYLDLGKFDDALRLLSFYQENWPEDINLDAVCYWQAVTHDKMNDHQSALELYQKILISFPNSIFLEDARNRARQLDQLLKKEQS